VTAKNPFADQPNPFQAVAAPKPTINQLRTGGQVTAKTFLAEFCGSMNFCADPNPRIQTSEEWIRIMLFSSVTFKTSTKNYFKFFAYYFLKVHLHHFSKIKSRKEVKFSYYLHDDRRIHIKIRISD
jgi:hypothetical protein